MHAPFSSRVVFELAVARFEDADLVDRVTALAIRLGGGPGEVFFRRVDCRPLL